MARILLSDVPGIDWSSPLGFLTREEVPQSIQRKAAAAFKRDSDREDAAEASTLREWKRLTRKSRNVVRHALRDSLSRSQLDEAKASVRATRERWPGFDGPVELVSEKAERSVVVGSLELTEVPPYDFWSIKEKKSGPATVTTVADKTNGVVSCLVKCPDDGAESSGISRAGLGIYFKPLYSGEVKFGAHPSLIYFWYTSCFLADAQSRGAIGLRVYRFALDGTLVPSPNNPPWDVHEWWAQDDFEMWYSESDGPPHEGSFTPWMDVNFDVSKNSFYNLWFYARVNAAADGGDWYYDSASQAYLSGTVPKLKWKFVW